MRIAVKGAALLGLWLTLAPAAKAGSSFAYVDSRIVLTVEFSGPHAATLNLFNLTDYVAAFKAQDLLVIAEGNVLHLGQVILRENPRAGEDPLMGSTLIKPWTYQGLSIEGAFPALERISEVVVVLGGKRLAMVRSDAAEFDELASRVESLDLKKRDGAQIIEDAAIARRGKIQYPTGEQDDLDLALRKILGPEDINPPRLISRTKVKLTEAAIQAGIRGRIRLSVSLSRYGELKAVKVVRGLGFGLDERAMEVVRNSWKFLPATQRSELVEVSMTVEAETADP